MTTVLIDNRTAPIWPLIAVAFILCACGAIPAPPTGEATVALEEPVDKPPLTSDTASATEPMPDKTNPPAPPPEEAINLCNSNVVHLTNANLDHVARCEMLQGSLVIEQDQIQRVKLPRLRTINGDLYIQKNTQHIDLTGLTRLQSIRGQLSVTDNAGLRHLGGLSKITWLQSVHIARNAALESISDLCALTIVEQSLDIEQNDSLANLAGLEQLKQVRNVSIDDNKKLTHLMSAPSQVREVNNLMIRNNPGLKDVAGFENLRLVTGVLTIGHNSMLTSLNGLAHLTVAMRWISIFNNGRLTNLDGLSQLRNINDYLDVTDNPQLIDISALNKLPCRALKLHVARNPKLSGGNAGDGRRYGICPSEAKDARRTTTALRKEAEYEIAARVALLLNKPTISVVDDLLYASKYESASQLFNALLMTHRAQAMDVYSIPGPGANYDPLHTENADFIVKYGVSEDLLHCFGIWNETHQFEQGSDICNAQFHHPVQLRPNGPVHFVSAVPWQILAPWAIPDDFYGRVTLLFSPTADGYRVTKLPGLPERLQFMESNAIALNDVIVFSYGNSGSHQTSVQYAAFRVSHKRVQPIWQMGKNVESTCLADHCEPDDDYNGVLEVWLTDITDDGNPEIITIEEDNCDLTSLQSTVFKQSRRGKMSALSATAQDQLLRQQKEKMTNGQLQDRQLFLLLNPHAVWSRNKIIQTLSTNEESNASLLTYHRHWQQKLDGNTSNCFHSTFSRTFSTDTQKATE